MVKKTTIEERQERLEQGFEALSLEFRNQNADLKEWMAKLELRFQKKHRRRRKGSSTIDNDGEDEGDGDSSGTEHSGGSNNGSHCRYPGRKLEIPVFEGEGAYAWLVKVERYFRINGVEEEDMLEAVMIALDGRALNWFQWWEEQHPEPNWEEFKQAVIRRFQPELFRNPLGPILNVKQTGTVMEYREQFELLMAPLKKRERVMLESIFLNGLRDEIQAELKLHNIRGLNALMDRALLIEERNKALKDNGEKKNEGSKWKMAATGSGYDPSRSRTFIPKAKTNAGTSGGGSTSSNSQSGGGAKKQGMRRDLSQEKLEERSRKGLCFKCGERWGRDHTCKMKHYRIALIEESGSEKENEEDEPVKVVESEGSNGEIAVEFKQLLCHLGVLRESPQTNPSKFGDSSRGDGC